MKKYSQGLSLVEVIIGAAIISTGILALITGYTTYVSYALANQKNVQAAYLLEETLEAVTLLRDKSWATYIQPLTTSTTYYLEFKSTYWAATTTPVYVDSDFLRSFTISNVNRDGNDKITSSGGTNDPNTKLITATIQYRQGNATTTKTMRTYITNI